MKTFLIIMLAISLTVPAFSKTEKKLSPVIGYYVVFQQKGQKPQKVKTIYLAEVYAAAELVFRVTAPTSIKNCASRLTTKSAPTKTISMLNFAWLLLPAGLNGSGLNNLRQL